MSIHVSRALILVVAVACLIGSAPKAAAQLDQLSYMLKFNRGQTVQPVFQGWSRNADGTYDMHFGYLNRNYVEELQIPIGPDNFIEPGGPDRGQPSFFFTRVNRQIFAVTVPADFGDQEVVWEIRVAGTTERAVGWLQAEWEIDVVTGGRRQSAEALKNQAPSVSVSLPGSVSLPSLLTLTAAVTDDGLPEPQPEPTPEQRQADAAAAASQGPTQAQPPILIPPDDAPEIPTNLPGLRVNARGRQSVGGQAPSGLSVSYRLWRGPAAVAFEPEFAEVGDGTAVTTATFAEPGEYMFQVRAYDGAKSTYEFVTVTARVSQP
jgi:hypothetical protein